MSTNESKIVPFGKYRGSSIDEVMVRDPSYCEWLAAQPWVREKFQNLHLTIINTGAEPQDSPEHNLMQARLADNDYLTKVILDPFWKGISKKALTELNMTGYNRPDSSDIDFEIGGWDCVVKFKINGTEQESPKYPSIVLLIEAKPTIGDDYPSIVRDVNTRFDKTIRTVQARGLYHRYESFTAPYDRFMDDEVFPKRVIWFDTYTGSVPLSSLRKMFKSICFIQTTESLDDQH